MLIDLHSHRISPHPNQLQVVTFDPDSIEAFEDMLALNPDVFWAMGVHPWNASKWDPEALQGIFSLFRHHRVVAVGEIGLDKTCGVSADEQKALFEKQLSFAEQLKKPVVLHIVRAMQELLEVKDRFPHIPAWIIHGFRSRPEVLDVYVKKGFYLSFGMQSNPESLKCCPLDLLFLETDEGQWNIQEVYVHVSGVLGIEVSVLEGRVEQNFHRVFPGWAFSATDAPFLYK
jgi:TatD DNase family protein